MITALIGSWRGRRMFCCGWWSILPWVWTERLLGWSYSETSCLFARHFAILSRNVGILIGSLLQASCNSNFNLLPEQTVFHIGILWVDCDGKQHYLCFKEGKSNFPLVVGLSKWRNKPSTRTFKIEQGLLANAICTPANLPARSTISDIVRQDLQFTWKNLSVHPAESLTHENLLKTLNYIMYMSGVDPCMVHFLMKPPSWKQRQIGVTDIARKAF